MMSSMLDLLEDERKELKMTRRRRRTANDWRLIDEKARLKN